MPTSSKTPGSRPASSTRDKLLRRRKRLVYAFAVLTALSLVLSLLPVR